MAGKPLERACGRNSKNFLEIESFSGFSGFSGFKMLQYKLRIVDSPNTFYCLEAFAVWN